ncbi:hypothetical protein CLOM_g22874 [Closterium sp. NIES-68]|nr:hypothetical protein CLOM_g22874 [Closterium sp. NIES-68]GJP77132.1 hypothetical protein CLOP_g7565 [Closterium sp. NIES-67]
MPSPLHAFDRAPPAVEGIALLRLGEIGDGPAGLDGGNQAAVNAWLAEQGAQGIGGTDGAVGVESPKHSACPQPSSSASSSDSPGSTAQPILVAQQALPASAAALYVPAPLLVTADRVAEEEPKLLPYNVSRKEKPWTAASVLAAWLLRERAKGAKSKWAAFIGSLPQYAPVPMLFEREVVELFDYPPMLRRLALYREAFEEEYLRSKAKAVARASKSHFFWALSLVLARALPLLPYTHMPHGLLPSQLPATAAAASPVGKVVAAVRAREKKEKEEGAPTAHAAAAGAGAGSAAGDGSGSAGSSEGFCSASAGGGEFAAGATGCSVVQQQWVGTSAEELADSLRWVEQWMGAGAGQGRRSRFSGPLLLLPLPAGFVHSHSPNVEWKWQETASESHSSADPASTITFRALASIPPNAPLSLNLGALPNDVLFALHGQLPAFNPHDRVPLFHTSDSLLAFLLSLHRLRTPGGTSSSSGASQWYDPKLTKEQEAALTGALEVAEDAVNAEVMRDGAAGTAGALQQYPLPLSLWDEVDGGAYNTGADGQVEPRLVAALAAVWFKWKEWEDLDWQQLARTAVAFSRNPFHPACPPPASSPPIPAHLVEALAAAVEAISERAQQVLSAFATSAEADQQLLRTLAGCRLAGAQGAQGNAGSAGRDGATGASTEGNADSRRDGAGEEGAAGGEAQGTPGEGGNGGGGASGCEGVEFDASVCTAQVMRTLGQREMVVRFRLGKKQLLRQLVDRLSDACIHAVADGEGGTAAAAAAAAS